LSKVVATYWDNSTAVSFPADTRTKTAKRAETTTPQWFVFAAIASITFMLCIAINLRAYSEISVEMEQNQRLSVQLESLANENLAIQEEVHNLKIDSRFVEQEARKIGMSRPNEKIPVPAN
jgi:cell division protein FtsB